MRISELTFHKIISEVVGIVEGKIFGAPCINLVTGKTVAIFWKNEMLFKLDDKNQKEALKLKGSKIGSHLYAPERPLKGWILIPPNHSDKWMFFTIKAVEYARSMLK